jgi:hypothetical protein
MIEEISNSVQKRNKRGPLRRLAATGFLLAIIGAFTATTLGMDWYRINLNQYSVLDFSGNNYTDVNVSQGFTISEIVNIEPVAELDSMGKELINQKTPSSIFGFPKTIIWYFLGVALLVVGSAFGSVSLAVSGLIALVFSWRELISIRNLIENPYFGGDLSVPAEGLRSYQMALMLTLVLAISCVIQSSIILFNKRRDERKRALSNGEEITPTLLESITGLISISQNYKKEGTRSKV